MVAYTYKNVSKILLMFLEIEKNEYEKVSFVPCTYSKLYGLSGWSKHLLDFMHVMSMHKKL